MLSPKKLKFRKQFKGRLRGNAVRGNELHLGDYALQAVEHGKITARQIEAARIAMTRYMKRGGDVWIKIFPHKPVTKKPAEVRMGKGKGSVDHYEARVKPGHLLYEIKGVDAEIAKQAMELAAAKLPVRTRFLMRNTDVWSK